MNHSLINRSAPVFCPDERISSGQRVTETLRPCHFIARAGPSPAATGSRSGFEPGRVITTRG